MTLCYKLALPTVAAISLVLGGCQPDYDQPEQPSTVKTYSYYTDDYSNTLVPGVLDMITDFFR